MGIQDRDYWRERYDVLHDRKPARCRLRLVVGRVNFGHVLTWAAIMLVVFGLVSMGARFIGHR